MSAQPGSLASYQVDRRRVYRHYFTNGQKWRLFFDEYATIILLLSCLGGLVFAPALVWPAALIVVFVWIARTIFLAEQWELACPHFEYVGRPLTRYFYAGLGLRTAVGQQIAKSMGIKDPWRPGEGLVLLGFNKDTGGKQVWASKTHLCTHILNFGTTGSGKTQWLLGLLQQFVHLGSGGVVVDGKSDVLTWYLIYGICRMFGREDDLLVINMLTAGNTTTTKRRNKNSNTSNLFAVGSSDSLMELLSALMGEAGASDGMWRGRAEALGRAVLRALVEKRDRGEMILSVDTIRAHLTLDAVEKLSKEPLSEMALVGLNAYLRELPGYEASVSMPGPGGQQARAKASEQHGYLAMQFTAVLELLSGTYGHIMRTDLSEVDWKDVIANRRIVYVMLPSMEKSPESLKNLGRMVVTAIRSALVPILGGDKLTGDRKFLADARATNADIPYLIALDEYGSYAVEGFGDVAAQARSLGICTVFAGQDFASFQKGSEIEAERIIANTGIKIFMKTESVSTAEEAIKRAGKQYQVLSGQGGALQAEHSELGSTFRDSGSAGIVEIDKISLSDLVAQEAGEAHILFADKLWRVKSFYGDYEKPAYSQVNHFVKVYRPDLTGEGEPPELAATREREAFLAGVLPSLTNPAAELAIAKPGESEVGAVADILDALRAIHAAEALADPFTVGVRAFASAGIGRPSGSLEDHLPPDTRADDDHVHVNDDRSVKHAPLPAVDPRTAMAHMAQLFSFQIEANKDLEAWADEAPPTPAQIKQDAEEIASFASTKRDPYAERPTPVHFPPAEMSATVDSMMAIQHMLDGTSYAEGDLESMLPPSDATDAMLLTQDRVRSADLGIAMMDDEDIDDNSGDHKDS
jgi:hypothetical protein